VPSRYHIGESAWARISRPRGRECIATSRGLNADGFPGRPYGGGLVTLSAITTFGDITSNAGKIDEFCIFSL
jgi:hypothetical protein